MKISIEIIRGRVLKSIIVCSIFAILSGCAYTPESITHETPAKPNVTQTSPMNNGSIFQSSSFRPMYEDRKAMYVGDTITIVINEKTTAAKQGSGSGSHTGSTTNSMLNLFTLSAKELDKMGVSTSTANKFEDKGATASSNNFTGTISATVADVLPNGNLLVKGEKQIAMDHGAEYIRVSGIVDPRNITSGNMISSSLVADARVEYRSNTRVDMADFMSMIARFFMSVSPI
jgi:flagellar L-ring protein FlgH